MPRLHLIDWLVVALYGAIVIFIGAWANRRQKTTEDYLLGGRKMRWWAVGVSLIATSFSSAALIGGTGYGFSHGMSYLQLQIGDLLGVVIAVVVFVPFFSRLRLTTAYEYLELRFGVAARSVASIMFIGQTLMRTGVLILGPAIALAVVTDLDIRWAIAASGLAALIYSAAGGITAVVWTDLIQFTVIVICVVLSLVLVWGDVPGGAATVWDDAAAEGRMEVVSTALDLGTPFSLWGALLAYGTLVIGVAGTNQQAVQRYLSCTDLKAARRAAFLGWGIGFAAVALTLFLGTTLHTWSEAVPEGAALKGAGDSALPLFILYRLPMGIAGLMVAAIFAASMSSMDSAIHSMSTSTLVDFVRRFRKRPLEQAAELRLARWLTVGFGVIATLAALTAASQGKGLLVTMITWLGYVAGPLLGLFALGVLSRRTTEFGALAGTAVGAQAVILPVLLDIPAEAGVHPLWLAPMALMVTFSVGYLVSLLDDPPPREKVEGLTLHG